MTSGLGATLFFKALESPNHQPTGVQQTSSINLGCPCTFFFEAMHVS